MKEYNGTKETTSYIYNRLHQLTEVTYNTFDELETFLKEGKYEYYIIMSSDGLSGWILSKGVHQY